MEMRPVSCLSKTARLFLAATVALSAGCASQGGLKNVTQESYGGKPPAQSLVIGNLDIKSPKELGLRMPTFGSAGNRFYLMRISPAGADSANLFHHLEWSGDFCFLLDPGKYAIVRVEGPFSTLSRTGNFTIGVDLPFEVPEGKAIYIGSIEIKFTLTFMGNIEDLRITIHDKYDESIKTLGEKYPFLREAVENRPIKLQ